MDLFGKQYVIDHCIQVLEENFEQKAFRIYVSDLLKVTAELLGGTVDRRYADIISKQKEPELSGDEIALKVIENAGLKVKANDVV